MNMANHFGATKRLLIAFALSTIAVSGVALGMVQTSAESIVRIQSFTDYNNGDVVFETTGSYPLCYGFWLSPADGNGAKQALTSLMMARSLGAKVIVYAYDTNLWPGSSTYKYCKVRSLTVEPN